MTDQKKEETKKTGAPKDRFQAEFEALPLDRKFASLMKMELATLNEAFTYAVNEPMKVVEKFGDVISEFGTKLENEVKKATQSGHANKSGAGKRPAAKPKTRTARKPAPPRAPKA